MYNYININQFLKCLTLKLIFVLFCSKRGPTTFVIYWLFGTQIWFCKIARSNGYLSSILFYILEQKNEINKHCFGISWQGEYFQQFQEQPWENEKARNSHWPKEKEIKIEIIIIVKRNKLCFWNHSFMTKHSWIKKKKKKLPVSRCDCFAIVLPLIENGKERTTKTVIKAEIEGPEIEDRKEEEGRTVPGAPRENRTESFSIIDQLVWIFTNIMT